MPASEGTNYAAKAQATGIAARERYHNIHDRDTGKVKKDFQFSNLALSSEYLWEIDAEETARREWPIVSEQFRDTRLDAHMGKLISKGLYFQ